MIEKSPGVEVVERARLQELEARYLKLYDFAKDQKFVIVYRAEGDQSWQVDRSGSSQLQGTWYTERYDLIERRYKPEIEDLSGMPAKVYGVIVPKSLLDDRDPMDKGMVQVNVINEDLRGGRKEVHSPDTNEPELEDYLNQFAFVREYRELKEKYQSA